MWCSRRYSTNRSVSSALVVTKRHARVTQLTRVQLRRKPMDLAVVDACVRRGAQVRRADRLVVAFGERGEGDHGKPLVQPQERHAFAGEHELLALIASERRKGQQRSGEEILPRVGVRAAGDHGDELEVVHDHGLVCSSAWLEDAVDGLVQRQRIAMRGRLDELARRQIRAARLRVKRRAGSASFPCRGSRENSDAGVPPADARAWTARRAVTGVRDWPADLVGETHGSSLLMSTPWTDCRS